MNSIILFVTLLFAVALAQPHEKPIYGSPCHQARNNANRGGPVLGRSVPECDENGNYAARQCQAGTQYCNCVAHDGTPLTEKRTDIGDCKCARLVSDQKAKNSPTRPLVGAFLAECSENGSYKNKQCHGSTGLCWCVDASGKQLGEKVRGDPKC